MQGVKKGCECDMCKQGAPGPGGGGGKQRHSSGGSNHGEFNRWKSFVRETLLQYSGESGVIVSSMLGIAFA